MGARLENIPLETLRRVAEYLDASHRPSLGAFSLTNRRCYNAALPLVLMEVRIHVSSAEALRSRTDYLRKAFSGAYNHVRHVRIEGFLKDGYEESEAMQRIRVSMQLSNQDYRDSRIPDVFGDLHQNPCTVCDKDPVNSSCEENAAWEPLVDFVKAMPYLTKLIYDCRNQFPYRLLDAIHHYHPQCRLHIHSFYLRSLDLPTPVPREMALATSPCLYKVKLMCSWRDTRGEDDYNRDALKAIAAGLAPNLKEIVVVRCRPPTPVPRLTHPEVPWHGFPEQTQVVKKGALVSFTLEGWCPLEYVEPWSAAVDFGVLQHLDIGSGMLFNFDTGVTDDCLEWISIHRPFQRLKTLRIRLIHEHENVQQCRLSENAVSFFESLNPLEELSVSGSVDGEILTSILSKHGATLRKLGFLPLEKYKDGSSAIAMVLNPGHVLQIQNHCPNLEELATTVARTVSDPSETAVYRSLGKLRSVRTLFLTLDCSSPNIGRSFPSREVDPSFDEFDREYYDRDLFIRNGDVKNSIIKSAVDRTLAWSIWETIRGAKEGRPLQSLKIYPADGCLIGETTSFRPTLSRSWLIETSIRDDEDAVTVKEIGLQARKASEKFYESWGQTSQDAPVREIMRRIWPGDWRQDWKSFPLG